MESTNKSVGSRQALGQINNSNNTQTDVSVDNDLAPMMTKKLQISTKNNFPKNEETVTTPDSLAASSASKEDSVDWEKERKDIDKIFDQLSDDQLKGLPRFKMPKQFVKGVSLFNYQKDGVRWLLQQERNPRQNPFFFERNLMDGSTGYYCRFTKQRLTKPYPPIQGAILADDMGLGKTIQTLALILLNPQDGHDYPGDGSNACGPVCTLIVCPKTVISSWQLQIEKYLKPDTFRVAEYMGQRSTRCKMIIAVQNNEYDIMLTSYETLSAELTEKTDRKGNVLPTLFDTCFHRVVLDEAQQIRNVHSKGFKAISSLQSDHKIALTGTPFVNNPSDIHSLVSFVGLEPLSDVACYKAHITQPIMDKKRAGLTRLRTAMAYAALRRTKNSVSLSKNEASFADKQVEVRRVEFEDNEHKRIHDCLYLTAQAAFGASINGRGNDYTGGEDGVNATSQQALFEMLLRVRQACAHGQLVPKERYIRAMKALDELREEDGTIKKLSANDGDRLIEMLQAGSSTGSEEAAPDSVDHEELGPSPKVQALLSIVEEMGAGEKAVVFSQWTSFLDLIGKALTDVGHRVARIDGTMDSKDRTETLKSFEECDECRFILCSIKAAGTGISLTRANVVFMMDPWWNDAIESQAIDRVHRVGQTKDVRVYRLVMKDSIEERMLNIQEAKAALGKGSMQRLSHEEEKIAKVTALKDLFQIKDDGHNDVDETDDWFY